MTPQPEDLDVVVIGGGPVGENAADRAARTGLSVALVEGELLGGECSYWACMPSKALLRAGAARAAAATVPGISEPARSLDIDTGAVFAWRDRMTSDWDDSGQAEWVGGAGVTLVRGHARLAGERLVRVGPPDDPSVADDSGRPPRLLRARRAVIVATGSVPVLPDIPGLAEAQPWGSREATAAESVPDSLTIVGGGVVGCELATAFADLGARVTLLARGGLLSGFEDIAGAAVADELRRLGVDVRTGTAVVRVERPEPGGPVTVSLGSGENVTASELLVATGRAARTADLGVESVGLTPGEPLTVDDTLAVVGLPHRDEGAWLYACGDVTGRSHTTHQGKYQARVVGDLVAARFGDAGVKDAPTHGQVPPLAHQEPRPWSRYAATADVVASPQVVFTRPQVAAVGLTRHEAGEHGLVLRVVDYDLGSVAGAAVSGDGYAGTARILVDVERRVIVGATFVGPDAGEMLHAATIAVVGQVRLDRLWHAVPSFPTVSEVWLRLLEAYGL